MLTVRMKSGYRKDGNIVFVFHVLGTDAELAAYKEVQTKNGFYRQDDNEFTDYFKTVKNEFHGKPLFYSPVELEDGTTLDITYNGRVVPNNLNQLKAESRNFQTEVLKARANNIAQSQSTRTGGRRNAFLQVPEEDSAIISAVGNQASTGNPVTPGQPKPVGGAAVGG